MSTLYVIFQSHDDQIQSDDCTTRWSDSIQCSIPISGLYEGKSTNIMVMTGDENDIRNWILENVGKVVESTIEECESIGQTISPEGSTYSVEEYDGGSLISKTYTAGPFTIENGQTWTLTELVES